MQSDNLEQTLRQAEAAKHGSYDKRTHHLRADGMGQFINRLILEDSPYLLQHAHNPVNWFPWGKEAFALAAQENKPVFLSIGYSTCHWCHVMEVESFDNIEVAKLLNKDFIAIKLDREQYPDIDEIYMTGVQLMSGHGGWPMSNFLLPDGRPFFAATYFPAATFMQLLQQIQEAWQGKRDELVNSAASIDSAIHRVLDNRQERVPIDTGAVTNCVQTLLKREDRQFGGLAGAPKFPQEPLLLFMLDQACRQNSSEILGFVERAVNGMAEGGIYDQVGGGFHRYSVDQYWLVPHFEKMLYNQSQLGLVYLQAYTVTGNGFYRRVVEQTLNYVLRDMQSPDGGFYSATDADSEGEEGTFFLWSRQQLQEVLTPDETALVLEIYDVSDEGNFEGSNILQLQEPLQQSVDRVGEGLLARLDAIIEKLYAAREQRIHPLRDDKLIASWNAAMIHTLALAGWQLQQPDWLTAASKAADTLCRQLLGADGRLQRISLAGAASIDGLLEDYGGVAEALITLFDVTGQSHYLQTAARVLDHCLTVFWDIEAAAFYLGSSSAQGPKLPRSKNAADGATLSPVAVTLCSLQRMTERAALLDGDGDGRRYREVIDTALAQLAAAINEHTLSHTSLLRLIAQIEDGSLEPVRYFSAGLVRVTCRQLSAEETTNAVPVGRATVILQMQPGWHVTAPATKAEQGNTQALQLIAVDGRDVEVSYPDANTVIQLGNDRLPVYEGEVELQLQWSTGSSTNGGSDNNSDAAAPTENPVFRLTVQLCDDKQCLPPQSLTLRCV